jgi:two-component system chemotaxis sensor kinase CheA
MSQEIKDFFMEEAQELFDNLHSILLKNEEAGDISNDELDSLFRDVHTLKGGAGSVELVKFAGFTHHLETFMDMLRSGKVELNQQIIEFLIDGVGTMQDILDSEYSENIDESDYESMLEKLLSDIDTFTNQSKIEESEAIENSQLEEALGDNAAEMIDLFDKADLIINNIRDSNEADYDEISNLFRVIHTLKGSSQFLNLRYFPDYVHEIESLLDRARNSEIDYTLDLNEFISRSLTISKEIIDKELNFNIDEEDFNKKMSEIKSDMSNFLKEKDDEVLEFELFDESTSKDSSTDIGFELFDDTTTSEKDTPKVASFELFDEDTTPMPEVKKTKEVEVKKEAKKDLSLNKLAASASIRVNLDKIDQLMNRVGDLVITKSMLFQFTESIEDEDINKAIYEKLSELDRDIRELQESVMSVRMVPMESVYTRLPKMVRDLAKKLDKKVKFEHLGDSVEIDKMMVEGLMDPLTHIIRNSLDHGIEKPEDRYKKGKKETGKLVISAAQESGNIIITIMDDGAGINVEKVTQKAIENGVISEEELSRMSEEDKLMLIFNAGLSTAEQVTDVSGRGVGMDVVMNNINSLGGYIKVFSKKDKGSQFQIILPLTLAILDGLNVLVGDKKFILPLNSIVESLQPQKHMIKHVGEEKREILMLRKEFIPIIRLYESFNIKPQYTDLEDGMLIIVKTSNSKFALYVDDFLSQEQIVVKSLEKNYKKINGIGAATIRGDGSIGLILDIISIAEMQSVRS